MTPERKRAWWALGSLVLILGIVGSVLAVHVDNFRLSHGSASSQSTPPAASSGQPSATPPAATPSAKPPATAKALCLQYGAHSQTFFADPGKIGPDAFGPPVPEVGGVSAVSHNIRVHFCGGLLNGHYHGPDERYWAAFEHWLVGSNPNLSVPNRQWVDSVNQLVLHEIQWDHIRLGVQYYGPDGKSLMMLPPVGFPQVVPTRGTIGFSQVAIVPVKLPDGRMLIVTVRLKCGLQPYGVHIGHAVAPTPQERKLLGLAA